MAPASVSDEIEIVALHGVQHGFQCSPSRVGNGAWRQAVKLIGIIGVVELPIGPGKCPAQRLFTLGYRIDYGGIRLQAHATIEAVYEDAGDDAALFRYPRFLLND